MITAKRRFGLKLWSKDFIKNKAFVQSAEAALKDGKFDYLELFALPDTFEETQAAVKAAFGGVLAVIHAPHAVQKLDISNPEEFESNRQRLMSSQQFADMLGAEMIILHPGLWRGEKYLEESMRQFKAFGDARLTVENLPGYCSQTKRELHGITPTKSGVLSAKRGQSSVLIFHMPFAGQILITAIFMRYCPSLQRSSRRCIICATAMLQALATTTDTTAKAIMTSGGW